MITLPEKPKLSRLFRLQWEPAQNKHVLLYPEGMVQLNDSAAEILKRCDGQRTTADIVNDLETTFSASELQADVEDFLRFAQERGWLS